MQSTLAFIFEVTLPVSLAFICEYTGNERRKEEKLAVQFRRLEIRLGLVYNRAWSRPILVGLLFTLGSILMLILQYVGKDRINPMGKAVSDAKEESLGVLTDVVKGKSMIRSHRAPPYFLTKASQFFDRTEEIRRRLKNFRSLVYCLSGTPKFKT